MESARALTYLAWCLYDNHQPELAIQAFDYAQIFCPVDSTKLANLISLGIGACNAQTGDYVKGEQMLINSLKLSHNAGNRREEMMINTYLGDLYSNQAKESKAKAHFLEGRRIAHEIKDTVFESALLCNLGIMSVAENNAEDNFFTAIDLSREAGITKVECYSYVNLAEFQFNKSEYDKALRTLDRVNRLLPDIPTSDPILAYLHELTGSIYASQQDYVAAYNQMQIASRQKVIADTRIKQERAQYTLMMKDIVKECEMYRLREKDTAHQSATRLYVSLIIIALIIAVAFILLYRHAVKQRKELVNKSNVINTLQLTNDANVVEYQDVKHAADYLYGYYHGRNNLLEKISQMVKESYKLNGSQLSVALRNINNFVTQCISKENSHEYVARLSKENEDFVKRLLAKYPQLSKTDVQLATYYRLGLSTRDISKLSGKLATSVTTSRYRLRMDLNLPEDVDLTEFFKKI
jgi:ATP/maltotriose-dependent transcriptional regulator MalT